MIVIGQSNSFGFNAIFKLSEAKTKPIAYQVLSKSQTAVKLKPK